MNRIAAVLMFVSGVANSEQAARALPADVQAFVEQRDICDHFRGEYPYDEERRQFLGKNITVLCTGTDARLAALKQKYLGSEAVQSALSGYEVDIEAGE